MHGPRLPVTAGQLPPPPSPPNGLWKLSEVSEVQLHQLVAAPPPLATYNWARLTTSTSFKKTSNHLRMDSIFLSWSLHGRMLSLQSSVIIAANGSYLEFHDRGVAIC